MTTSQDEYRFAADALERVRDKKIRLEREITGVAAEIRSAEATLLRAQGVVLNELRAK